MSKSVRRRALDRVVSARFGGEPKLIVHPPGYLGAGKTTLLNYILNEQHGKKIAVILNGLYTPFLPFHIISWHVGDPDLTTHRVR